MRQLSVTITDTLSDVKPNTSMIHTMKAEEQHNNNALITATVTTTQE